MPTSGEVETVDEITGIYDKGKGAVVASKTVATLVADGQPLYETTSAIFIMGEGGFGGDRGPTEKANVAPDRDPDYEVSAQTRPDQALLYRLCGDKNPLHSDKQFSDVGGFPKPILHGLCTYGVVCKAAVDGALGGDVAKVARYQARFAGVVFPGETLVTSMWREGDRILIDAKTKERSSPVITNAAITLRA